MDLIGRSFIASVQQASTGATFHAVDPSTGSPLSPAFQSATSEMIDEACVGATRAFELFRDSTGAGRHALLSAIASAIEARAEHIIARANLETALPIARLTGELARTCGQLRMFARLAKAGSWVDARIDHADPSRAPVPKPDVRSMYRPIGPVAVFGASNFPLAFSVAGGDTASALAAGCPVVVKAHPAHPGTSELVGAAIAEAVRSIGAPHGTFSLILDAGHQAGVALVKHPGMRAVAFTGSKRGGLALMSVAAARPMPIPVFAEMGSVNPVCILPGALSERASAIASGLHASFTLGVGQFCTNPGVVFVTPSPNTDAFIAELGRLTGASAGGVMLTPSIRDSYSAASARLGDRPGVHLVAKGQAPTYSAGACAMVFETTAAVFAKDPELREEVFGPSTLIVRCADVDEMITCLRSMDGQLTATVHAGGSDDDLFRRLAPALEDIAGRILVNGFPTGVEVCDAMNHAGPFPATSDGRSTSVGTRAIFRFVRAVCYQNFPEARLPQALRDTNPDHIERLVDGERR